MNGYPPPKYRNRNRRTRRFSANDSAVACGTPSLRVAWYFRAESAASMLILASASPRRQELLRNAGIPFTVQVANIPEEHRAGETPETFVRRLAREKAQAVAGRNGLDKDIPILAADTEVVLDLSS